MGSMFKRIEKVNVRNLNELVSRIEKEIRDIYKELGKEYGINIKPKMLSINEFKKIEEFDSDSEFGYALFSHKECDNLIFYLKLNNKYIPLSNATDGKIFFKEAIDKYGTDGENFSKIAYHEFFHNVVREPSLNENFENLIFIEHKKKYHDGYTYSIKGCYQLDDERSVEEMAKKYYPTLVLVREKELEFFSNIFKKLIKKYKRRFEIKYQEGNIIKIITNEKDIIGKIQAWLLGRIYCIEKGYLKAYEEYEEEIPEPF